MLHIQKQNRFFDLNVEPGAGTLPTVRPETDLRTSNEVRAHNEAYNKEKEAILWYTQKGLTSMVDDIQKALVASGYELKVDGKLGPATIQAIMKFQAANGLKDDGKAGPKTMAKLGLNIETAPTEAAISAAPRETTKKQNKNPIAGFFESLFGNSTERIRYNKFNSLTQLDEVINSASGLGDLEKEIDAIKNTKNQATIDTVYNKMLQVLSTKVPANLYTTLGNARNTLEKAYVLSFVVNALMGGKAAPERIRENDIGSIIEADTRNATAQDREMSKALGINVSNLRERAHGGLKARGTYEQNRDNNNTKRVLWSLRSKHIGDSILSGLQPMAGSAIETVKINGNSDSINFKLEPDVLVKLVNQLDAVQLNTIKKNVLNDTRLTDDQVKQMILDGTIKTTAFYAKSANCFNDAIGLSFKAPVRVPESSDSDNHTPTPTEDPTSTPDEDGGGDEGGGGTDGDQGGGRT